jgi:hypothetical protein
VADDLAVIAVKGQPAMRHLYKSTPAFEENFEKFGEFAADPMVQLGVKNLITFNRIFDDLLGYVAPSQTVCNYPGILVRNIADAVSDRDGTNPIVSWLRIALVPPINEVNTEFSPSATLSNVDVPPSGPTIPRKVDILQSNGYPYTAAPGQPKTCGAGNEITKGKKAPSNPQVQFTPFIGNPNGMDRARTEDTEPVDQEALQK